MDSDPTYTPGSVDNGRVYWHEYCLGECRPASIHSLRVMEGETELSSCVLLADGGATAVHGHSALIRKNSCTVAVGAFLCSLELPSLRLEWHTRVDWATCFGVYHSDKHYCFISHGELEVARVSYGGDLVWSVSGKDIFTNGFDLRDDTVEVIDWNNETYRVDIASGAIRLVPA